MVSWGRLVSWGWLVGWSWVVRRLVFWVLGSSFVGNIGNVTVVVVSSIGYSLNTSVGKVDLVRSTDSLAISSLLGVEVGAGVIISNTVLEGVWFWGLIVSSWGVVWSWGWGVVWGWSSGHGDGDKSGGNGGTD